MSLDRRSFLIAGAVAGAAALMFGAVRADEPILIGVSGPLTGPNAQYGAQWKKGFDLALDEIKAAGGSRTSADMSSRTARAIRARAVAIAQKFVADPKIVVEVGDFSSHRLDGGLADLPARQAGAVRLHQLASRLHQGRRLHVEQSRQPGRRAAVSSPDT